MINKAKDYYHFLVTLNELTPKKAKEILDKWFVDCYGIKTPSEFNKWYYEQIDYTLKGDIE